MPRITDPTYVLIEAGMSTCFSSGNFSFELNCSADAAVVVFSRGMGRCRAGAIVGEQRVPISVAAAFIDNVNAVISQEDRETGVRFTTQYRAFIVEGEQGGTPLLDIASNDIPKSHLQACADDPATDPAFAERLREVLLREPVNRAYQLYGLAEEFAQALGYGPEH